MNLAGALPKFEYQPSRGRFRSYVGRIVRNAIIRHAQCPHPPESALDDYVLSTVSDEHVAHKESWDREWVDHHLRRAMRIIRQTHDPRGIDAFESLLAGKTTAQVAREMDMTVAAVQKVKQRIRSRLQRLVAGQLAEEAQQ
jgi:DNA-directed RNA polymerase specialized sigma24 family protein